MAAIGQSDNNFTTIALARYITAVANQGTVYQLTLLDHVEDAETGETLQNYAPTVRNQINVLSTDEWNNLSYGLRMVVEDLSAFSNVNVEVAGKTGTAQQDLTRPNHALFVGYAPYSNPEISVATRIAYGYSSGNASIVAADIFSYYFGETSLESVLGGTVDSVSTTNTVTD
jgi:penicillin-binding protein 2